jgi:hypothetical protein
MGGNVRLPSVLDEWLITESLTDMKVKADTERCKER